MNDKVVRELDVETRVVDGIEYRIVELYWRHGGVCFDVHRTGDDECISDESTNHIPDNDEIRTMAANHSREKEI